MVITVAQVNSLLQADKVIVSPMAWAKKLGNADPAWYMYASSVQVGDEIPESLEIIFQWRPSIGVMSQSINIGLYLSKQRIYAIDVAPQSEHKNNGAGHGRPFHKKFVGGIHEHLWSDDPPFVGYAEPLQVENIEDLETAWQTFLLRANLTYSFDFVHPDTAINGGQGRLL